MNSGKRKGPGAKGKGGGKKGGKPTGGRPRAKPQHSAPVEAGDNKAVIATTTTKETVEVTSKTKSKEEERTYWPTQPVPLEIKDVEEGTKGEIKKVVGSEVEKEPRKLPEGMKWVEIKINEDKSLQEIHDFLYENYVSDVEGKFRFAYTADFIRWALLCPGWKPEFHLGIRLAESNELIGFITASPVQMSLDGVKKHMVEINFLCVSGKMRERGLAPLLIEEIKRRVHVSGMYQAIYTAAIPVTTPLCTAQYYHRLISTKKLLKVGFCGVPKGSSEREFHARALTGLYNEIPEDYRIAKKNESGLLVNLFNSYHSDPVTGVKYHLVLSQAEGEHLFVTKDKIVKTFVHVTPDPPSGQNTAAGSDTKKKQSGGIIDGMVTYYSIPTSVPVKSGAYANSREIVRIAYLYCVCNKATGPSITELVRVAISDAAKTGHDVFNVLTLVNNKSFFDELRFGAGDGFLNYFLFNWRWEKETTTKDMSVVLF